jgi:uncharacterized protein
LLVVAILRGEGIHLMIVDEQIAVTDFLANAAAFETHGAVEVIETHISRIFLAGDRVFKLKRGVKLPYVDFSTPRLRLEACEKEVAFNTPSAPGLYLGARKIIRAADGSLAFEGEGELVDSVVEMVRFDQCALLDKVASSGALTRNLMRQTVVRISDFHARALVIGGEGGASNISRVLDINEGGFAASRVFSPSELKPFHEAFRRQLKRHGPLLDRRAQSGKLRRCHGDLHLRNIFLNDGIPCLFDCIEFNDQIAIVDVLYDFAFLLMDLWHRGLGDLANLAANRYLDLTHNDDGFVLLPFFMAVRAAVRAHVTATLVEENGDHGNDLADEARSYFNLALALLREREPQMIAIAGFSGSGKSTVAEALAERFGSPPGARLIESDRIRKALFAVSPETALGQEAYRPSVSERVYAEMARRSGAIIAAGGSVVVDGVFSAEKRRRQIAESASRCGSAFSGFWLDVGEQILHSRLAAREKGASDATLDVLAQQLANGAGQIDWRRLDGTMPVASIVNEILEAVALPPSSATDRTMVRKPETS